MSDCIKPYRWSGFHDAIDFIRSTGSIGCQCLGVVRNHPDLFEIEALATNRRDDLLWQQVREFKPSLVAIIDAEAAAFSAKSSSEGTQFFQGPNALCEMVQAAKGDVAVIATVARRASSTFEAIRQRKHIAQRIRKFWRWRAPAHAGARSIRSHRSDR